MSLENEKINNKPTSEEPEILLEIQYSIEGESSE